MQRHEIDPLSLVAGLMFGFVSGGYLLAQTTSVQLHWLVALPVGLLLLGAAVVAMGVRRMVRARAVAANPADLARDADLTSNG